MTTGRASYPTALVLAIVALTIPLLLTRFPPLNDYPNHLARAFILFRYDHAPFFQSLFVKDLEPTPNVACDVILVVLMRLFSPEVAGHVFLLLTVGLFAVGCHLLARGIHGKQSWLALPASFAVYSSTFLYGFVNYVFGVAMFCIAFGLWLSWRKSLRPSSVARLAILITLFLAAYLSHLTAYAFLGIVCVVVAAIDLLQDRKHLGSLAIALIPLVPPLIAFGAFMNGGGAVGRVEWNSVSGKIVALAGLLASYDPVVDALCVTVLIALLLLSLRGSNTGIHAGPFVAGLALLVIFFAAPIKLLTASAVDTRFVLPAALLILLSIDMAATKRREQYFIAACGVLLIRLAIVTIHWQTIDDRSAQEVAVLDGLPVHARIYPVFMNVETPDSKLARGMTQLPHYATLHREAYVPSLFAHRGQQPLVNREARQYVQGTVGRDWAPDERLRGFDYVWAFGLTAAARAELTKRCTPVHEDDGFLVCALMR